MLNENIISVVASFFYERRMKMCKEVVLSTEKLTKKYGNITTVNAVDLHVKKGRIYSLLGRNGA